MEPAPINIEDKIELGSQKCQIEKHNQNLFIGFCIDQNCKNRNKLLCSECIFDEHLKHDMIRIREINKEILKNIEKENQNISLIKEFNEEIKKLEEIYHLKIEELKKNIISIIEQKTNSFITNNLKVLKQSSKMKLDKNLININENYPINSLDKQIKISNLINTMKEDEKNIKEKFDKSYIQKLIEANRENFIKKKENIEKIIVTIITNNFNENNNLNLFIEINNPWTNTIFKYSNKFLYTLKDNNNLIEKTSETDFIHIVRSQHELKEGKIYKIEFYINYTKGNDLDVGFGTINLCETQGWLRCEEGICICNKGLFINGVNSINDNNFILENNIKIIFILNFKEEKKFFEIYKNEEKIGKFGFDLKNVYALVAIRSIGNSVRIKTFEEMEF